MQMYFRSKPHVPVAVRRQKTERTLAKLQNGRMTAKKI